ncbi:hypothetical protein E4U21_003214 [Claviceps maximensis]|nr:hypothetical protein E4U21_003214 [Claviceps maximensis]
MGLLGISILVASVVYVLVRPPTWLAHRLLSQRRGALHGTQITSASSVVDKTPHDGGGRRHGVHDDDNIHHNHDPAPAVPKIEHPLDEDAVILSSPSDVVGTPATPPPPLPSMPRPTSPARQPADDDTCTTPKASAVTPVQIVPSFSLSPSDDDDSHSPPLTGSGPPSMMPPPIPARQRPIPAAGRLPTLPQFPAPNSAQRARGPVPDRGPPTSSLSSSSALAPPPTHSSRPSKPSRKVTLDPGHSPLDWARISGPNADLRGIDPPSTSYLRVTPSMLKKQTGRKGKDAWMAINGRVYNITPYAAYHPGGIPELMRGAARDGTRLFGEVHPWVNYETMLSACLIGLLVDEPDGAGSHESEMDQMD